MQRTTGLRVGLLGPLSVHVDGREMKGIRGKPAIVLAVLALSAGQGRTAEALARAVWSEHPPNRVRGSIQSLVMRLRRVIGHDALRTTESGYALAIDPECVDVLRFRRLAAEAARLDEPERARALLDEALGLWRGDPLSGLRSDAFDDVVIPQLTEERLAALERRIEIDLAAGRHAGLIGELREVTSRHPLRESLWQALIVALARSGRRPEALGAYHELRVRLREELGVDPSAELRTLHRHLVTGRSIDADDTAPEPPDRIETPDQLPPDTEDYMGRTWEVATLRAMLVAETSRTVTVCAISGRGGIGKTALALHVAHGLRQRFPDGLLHVSLRGTHAEPREPADALDSFLRALGVASPAIPESLEARAELYRARLAGRRVLVVLDDAAGEGQVRPLLPGSPSCAVIVTSRTGLVGLEGARRLELELLPADDAVELLGRVAGPERVAAEAEAAREIVSLCARLPLAVRIAGARLAARPHWPLRRLLERLLDERRRLDELVQGDLEVRASIALSYRGLSDLEQRALRRLGMLDVPDFQAWVLAALLDVDATTAGDLVERLRDVQLLEICTAGGQRFCFHDLVRLFARERALVEETPEERREALRRALTGWWGMAEAGGARVGRGRRGRERRLARAWTLAPDLADTLLADPLAWFDGERRALVACIAQADEEGMDDLTCALATATAAYFETRAALDDWKVTHELALGAARRREERDAEGVLLWALGDLHTMQDRYEDALTCFRLAHSALFAAGDRQGQAAVLSGIGYIHQLRGHSDEALACQRRALAIADELGDRRLRFDALRCMGSIHMDLDRLEEAAGYYRTALDESRAGGYRAGEARILRCLGHLALVAGDPTTALPHVEAALALCRCLGDRPAEATTLLELAELRRQEGRPAEARAILERCLDMYREFGDRFNEAWALRGLGELSREEGSLLRAVEELSAAERIYDELRLPLWRSRVSSGLGAVYTLAGEPAAAAAAWRRAEAARPASDSGADETSRP